jgi:hypothetical protein
VGDNGCGKTHEPRETGRGRERASRSDGSSLRFKCSTVKVGQSDGSKHVCGCGQSNACEHC